MEIELGRGRGRGLGLSRTEDGLFLGRTALVERVGQGYAVRAPADLERLLARAYGAGIVVDRVMPGFRVVAAALGERNLGLAQIAAAQLRLPDLTDDIAPSSLETEDRLLKSARGDDRLARSGWDPSEHPRAGVPPNPGWFAPTDGGEAPTEIAQGEEEERARGAARSDGAAAPSAVGGNHRHPAPDRSKEPEPDLFIQS